MKNNTIDLVKEFHRTFNAPIIDTPSIPSKKRCDLRISLLEEELNELKDAIQNNDLIEVADALADIQYVLTGAVLEFGLGDKFDNLFDEVQRSNMSKACNTELEAKSTIEHYKNKDGTIADYKKNNGKWLVYRVSDEKVLKSINYSPANLGSIINM